MTISERERINIGDVNFDSLRKDVYLVLSVENDGSVLWLNEFGEVIKTATNGLKNFYPGPWM